MHILQHLTIIPIEKLRSTHNSDILEKEKLWIKTLHNKYPNGLNSYPIPQ